jgi:hypothetical protein
MRRDGIDRIRRLNTQRSHQGLPSIHIDSTLYTPHGHAADPEETAILHDTINLIATVSHGPDRERMVQACRDAAADGMTNFDAMSLAKMAKTTPNRRRDWARMIKLQLGIGLGLPPGPALEEE